MAGWDWYAFGETFLAVALGIMVGGFVVINWGKAAAYELLSHPTARKLANAADKFAGKGSGGMLDTIMGMLTGKGGPA